MTEFSVFQQFPPTRIGETNEDGDEWHAANLLRVGTVAARNGDEALSVAKTWTRFSQRSKASLLRWPIVEQKGNDQ